VVQLIAAAPGALTGRDGEGTARRLIIIGTIPIAIVGGLFGDVIERKWTPLIVAVNLVIGGIGSGWADWPPDRDPGLVEASPSACAGRPRPGLCVWSLIVSMFQGLRRDPRPVLPDEPAGGVLMAVRKSCVEGGHGGVRDPDAGQVVFGGRRLRHGEILSAVSCGALVGGLRITGLRWRRHVAYVAVRSEP
jgi:hypothetical protein